jgi:integrase
VREKALWRFLYETAARASEALAINVEDLDLDNKRVRVRSQGGDLDWLHFQTGSARLLPSLIAWRRRGPLFLTDRAPVPARAPATVDRCPETGRAPRRWRRSPRRPTPPLGAAERKRRPQPDLSRSQR